VRIYSRLSRLRKRLNLADCLLIVSAADALALVICDTLTYQTGALDGHVRSQKLSKVSFRPNAPRPEIYIAVTNQTESKIRLLTSTDTVCFKLFLRLRHGLPKGQHARLLLELLCSRRSPSHTQFAIRHRSLRCCLLLSHTFQQHVLLWQECVGTVVPGRRCMLCVLCPDAFPPQFCTQPSVLCRHLCMAVAPAIAARTSRVYWTSRDLRLGCSRDSLWCLSLPMPNDRRSQRKPDL